MLGNFVLAGISNQLHLLTCPPSIQTQEFFNQLDQRVLNAFLKACDELTDILPEQEQHSLQEAVRKLHRQWKVSDTEQCLWKF